MTNIDRSEASRMLGKCLAYAACGKRDEARLWLQKLYWYLNAALGGE